MGTDRRSFLVGLRRGLTRHCPSCGRGKLFAGYLKIESRCPTCGHDNGQYPSDDAPPYFTIFLVGHLVVAPLLAMSVIWKWQTTYVVVALLPLVGAVTLAALPFVKGAVVGAQWALRTPTHSEGTVGVEADSAKESP